MTLFHGTNVKINGKINKGTFFTDNFSLALNFMKYKKGNKIYAFSNSNKDIIKHLFDATDEFYTLKDEMSIERFVYLEVKLNKEIIYEKIC